MHIELGRVLGRTSDREEALTHLEAAIAGSSLQAPGRSAGRFGGGLGAARPPGGSRPAAGDPLLRHGDPRGVAPGRRQLSRLYKRRDVKTPSAAEKYPRAMRRPRVLPGRGTTGRPTKLPGDRRALRQGERSRTGSAPDRDSGVPPRPAQRLAPHAGPDKARRPPAGSPLLPRDRSGDWNAGLPRNGFSKNCWRSNRITSSASGRSTAWPAVSWPETTGKPPCHTSPGSREAYPNGQHGLFARWHVLWDRYRNGYLDGTAEEFERAARENPGAFMAGQFLYFAGAR